MPHTSTRDPNWVNNLTEVRAIAGETPKTLEKAVANQKRLAQIVDDLIEVLIMRQGLDQPRK